MHSIINGILIHVPSSFSGILPVSPSEEAFNFESPAFLGLKESIKQGDTVIDAGMSYGVMTVLMGLMVGNSGTVHSFEANRDVIPFGEELAKCNGLNNIIINHKIISNVSDTRKPFFVVKGFNSVASTCNIGIKNHVDGVEDTRVQSVTIDDYCDSHNIIPSVVKIDIEGSEYVCIEGMQRTITKYKPSLVIETHGKALDRIGGNIKELGELLRLLGYSLIDLISTQPISFDDFAIKYKEEIGYILAS